MSDHDPAAVEAAKQYRPDGMLSLAPHAQNELARIITVAYEEQHRRHPVPYESERDMLQESVNQQDEQLTAERKVREQLVTALQQTACHASDKTPCYNSCPRCAALAAAKKLEVGA